MFDSTDESILLFWFRWSRTPLDEATAFDHNEVVNLLRQNGARNGNFLHEDERNSTFASQQSQ